MKCNRCNQTDCTICAECDEPTCGFCECGDFFTTCTRCHMMSVPIVDGSAPDLCDSCEVNTTECDDCAAMLEWSERRKSWIHPVPSDCFMASIMPTFEPVSHECETANCGNLITVPHSNMYANCQRCDKLQWLEDHTEARPW